MPSTFFHSLAKEKTRHEVADPDSRTRWLVLCGDHTDPMFDYMLDAIDSLPRRQNLDFALANPNCETGHDFLERHMVSFFPTILLLRGGEAHSTISGAIGFDQLDRAVEEVCRTRPEDTYAELRANAESAVFVQVGVSDNGLPIFMRKADL